MARTALEKATDKIVKPKHQYELVCTKSRNKFYWGFSKRGSDAVTLVGQSRRDAMRAIHELYYGQQYIPVDGESVNVKEIEEVADEDSLLDLEEVA